MRSATSSCTQQQPQRRAALAGGAERRGHDVVGDLFGQRGGVDDHGVDAAGLGDQRHDRAVLGGQRAVDRARHLGRAGEDDAGDVADAATSAAPIAPSPGTRCSARGGHAGLVQQLDRLGGDQRRLLGGLGDHRIAGHQRGGDLAEKDRQREIPRARSQTNTPRPRSRSTLLSPVGPGIASPSPNSLRASRGVVAAEVDRLAHFGRRVVERLAALALQQRDEARRVAAPAGRRRVRASSARSSAGVAAPARESPSRAAAIAASRLRRRRADRRLPSIGERGRSRRGRSPSTSGAARQRVAAHRRNASSAGAEFDARELRRGDRDRAAAECRMPRVVRRADDVGRPPQQRRDRHARRRRRRATKEELAPFSSSRRTR